MIEKALQRDPVTGLFNQRHFLSIAAERLEKSPAAGIRAFIFMRPDRFAQASNDLGLVGTEAIIAQLAQMLREFMQPNDVYGRVGGTLFAMLIERGTMDDAESWARRLRQTVAHTVFEYANRSTAITCSIGLCEVEAASSRYRKTAYRSRNCLQKQPASRRQSHGTQRFQRGCQENPPGRQHLDTTNTQCSHGESTAARASAYSEPER